MDVLLELVRKTLATFFEAGKVLFYTIRRVALEDAIEADLVTITIRGTKDISSPGKNPATSWRVANMAAKSSARQNAGIHFSPRITIVCSSLHSGQYIVL